MKFHILFFSHAGAADSESLVISLYNGKTVKATTQMAVWIPVPLHDRIKLETQMPLSARQYLINSPHYPSHMPPGYMLAPPGVMQSQGETFAAMGTPGQLHQPMFIPTYPMGIVNADFHMPVVGQSAVRSADVHKLIPGTSMTKEELNRKVMSQLVEHKMVEREEVTTYQDLSGVPTTKSCMRKSVSFKEGEFDSGVSSIHTDDEERKQESVEEMTANLSEDDEEDLETLKMKTLNMNLNNTDDSGIDSGFDSGIGSGIGSEPKLLFSMSDHREPRRPRSAIPENRPPWRHFGNGSSAGGGGAAGAKHEDKGFRKMALECPPQVRSQPIYLDAELAFDRAEPTYLESRPMSTLSTYDDDYNYPSERQSAQLKQSRSQPEYPPIRSSIQYDNSYRYPADNISPHSKAINAKIQSSPMLQAERVLYYNPQQTTPVGVIHTNSAFNTVDHSPVMVPDGPINRKSVFRTVNPDGIKSDRIQLEWLLRNQHTRPRPPSASQSQRVPTHKAFATRDMVRETKETAYMEFRRMQIVKREGSFKEKEENNSQIKEKRLNRLR